MSFVRYHLRKKIIGLIAAECFIRIILPFWLSKLFIRHTIGSGSLEQDSPLSIVAKEEKKQTCLMHQHRFGKRERHADKTSETLTERIIPELHVGGLSPV